MSDPTQAVVAAARDLLAVCELDASPTPLHTWEMRDLVRRKQGIRRRLSDALRALDAAGPCGDCALPHGSAACHSCAPTLEATIDRLRADLARVEAAHATALDAMRADRVEIGLLQSALAAERARAEKAVGLLHMLDRTEARHPDVAEFLDGES